VPRFERIGRLQEPTEGRRMSRRLGRVALATALALSGTAVVASSASASYHDNRIREVHETGGDGDYVVLQAFSAGQNFVAGRQVVTYDGGGNAFSRVALSNVANGSNQATILVGDTGVAGADATDSSFNVINTGGTVCFSEGTTILSPPTGVDCVAYAGGTTTFPAVPPASPYGTPLSLGAANFDGKSLVRTITRGCATALDAGDDTNDSAADFSVTTSTNPRNNAAPITETACPPGNPASPTNPAGKTRKRKCKKKQKRSAAVAKKKKCKKKKRR
jgi:hypothetical protein